MCRGVVGRLLNRRLANTVRLIRRRCLIAGRRFGQRSTRRLARKFRRFFLLVAKHGVPHTACARAKLGRHQLAAEAGGRRVIPVVGFGRLLFLVFSTASRRQLVRAQGVLFALSLVTNVAILLHGRFSLSPRDVRILRPRWIVGYSRIASLGWRRSTVRRRHQRATFLVVDGGFAVALKAEPFHDAAINLLIDRDFVVS